MPSILPTEPVAPSRVNPKIITMYGLPKVGKTTLLTELDNCLIEDMEAGATSVTALRVPVPYINGKTIWKKNEQTGKDELSAISFMSVYEDICATGNEQASKGLKAKFPYRRIAIDTLDRFEDMCEKSATIKYKDSILGKNFEGDSVLELPKGAGYYHLRNEVLDKIEMLSKACETLILIAHTKEKITDRGGVEMTSTDISLTGKLSAMVCAKSDAIVYLFRETGKPIMASLETSQGGVMGARRFPHLEKLIGTKFEFSWDKLLIDPPKV